MDLSNINDRKTLVLNMRKLKNLGIVPEYDSGTKGMSVSERVERENRVPFCSVYETIDEYKHDRELLYNIIDNGEPIDENSEVYKKLMVAYNEIGDSIQLMGYGT